MGGLRDLANRNPLPINDRWKLIQYIGNQKLDKYFRRAPVDYSGYPK
jgi:hypothetical protein